MKSCDTLDGSQRGSLEGHGRGTRAESGHDGQEAVEAVMWSRRSSMEDKDLWKRLRSEEKVGPLMEVKRE